ncbi:MAG: TolC family protein [Rickettsiales bacterium]|nr:TolC family protein [Rickettsiales bacterium]
MRLALYTSFISILLTTSAFAEPMPLEQVIARVLEKSPASAQVKRDFQDRLSEGTAAKTWNNPELQADVVKQTTGTKGKAVQLELTQPVKLSQINGARHAYAKAVKNAAGTQQKYELFKMATDVSTLYLRLWLLQERRDLYTRLAKDAGEVAETIHAGAHQGQLATSESILFTSDSERLKTEVDTIKAEISQAKISLAKLTGFSFANIEAVKPTFSHVPEVKKLTEFASSHATVRAVTRDNFTAAQKRVEVAEDDRFPTFGPRLIYNRGFNGDTQRSTGVGLAINIPLWDTNQAERQRAHAALDAAQADLDSSFVQNPQEILGQLQESAKRLQTRSERYWDKILPGFRKSYDLSRQMLRAGQIPALDLWQVRDKLYQVEDAALQSTLDAYAARLALELQIGGKLEEIQ